MVTSFPDISSLGIVLTIKDAISSARKNNCKKRLEFAGVSLFVDANSDISERVAFWEEEYEKKRSKPIE